MISASLHDPSLVDDQDLIWALKSSEKTNHLPPNSNAGIVFVECVRPVRGWPASETQPSRHVNQPLTRAEAGVDLPGGDELAAAVAENRPLPRTHSLFDVALVTQGMPTRETIEMCRRQASHGS